MRKHNIFRNHRQLNNGETIQEGDVWFLQSLDGNKTIRQIKGFNCVGSTIGKVVSPNLGFIEGTIFLRRKEKKVDK